MLRTGTHAVAARPMTSLYSETASNSFQQFLAGASGMSAAIEIEVQNPSGLHARPAAVFVRAASAIPADVRVANVTTGSAEVSAKSILAVLGLGVSSGHRIRLRVEGEGEDETGALAALVDLVTGGLGETLGGSEV